MRAFLFGTGTRAERAARAHVAALCRSSYVLAGGPALPRCDRLAGNAVLGSRCAPCGCVDVSAPTRCPYATRYRALARRLQDGRIVVFLDAAHREGEVVDGIDLSPSLAVEIDRSLLQGLDPSDTTTRPLPEAP